MFDLSYLTAKPAPGSPPSRLPMASPGAGGAGTLGTKPDPRPAPPVIQAQPCGCRINTTARTMHVPCTAHQRCPFCRGTDLVFNSKPEQINCPHCGTKTKKG